MTIKSIITGIFLISFSFTMQAQTTAKKITKNQIKQQQRIKQGVQSGELTRREATKLKKEQANIQRTIKLAKSDGVITRKERTIIEKKQAIASKNIATKTHNKRDKN